MGTSVSPWAAAAAAVGNATTPPPPPPPPGGERRQQTTAPPVTAANAFVTARRRRRVMVGWLNAGVGVRVHSFNNVPYQHRDLENRCILGAYPRRNRPKLNKTAQHRPKSSRTAPGTSGTIRVRTWLGTLFEECTHVMLATSCTTCIQTLVCRLKGNIMTWLA